MGHGSFTASAWEDFTTTRIAGKTTEEIFKSRTLKPEFNPASITTRESCDSVDNPNSTAIAVLFDVTGSMRRVPLHFVKENLPVLFTEIYNRKPVSDPHILVGCIGDVDYSNSSYGSSMPTHHTAGYGDSAPLQVTQFEADIRIAEQLTDLYLEGGGGGNSNESYPLAWYFAAMKTEIDCFKKRGKKGYLFTLGDEFPPQGLTAAQLEKVFGPGQYSDLTSEQLYRMAAEKYHVYHIFVKEGGYASMQNEVCAAFRAVGLGENVICLEDHTKLSEVIISLIEFNEGKDKEEVAKSWSGDTALVVATALNALTKRSGGAVATGATGAEAVAF